jgi:hypothetical protein
MLDREIGSNVLKYSGVFVFSILCFLPVFIEFPFTANIYLTYEGAYRLYLGQVPFVDFGSSVGPGMWLLPALFFKIFGPFFSSLIKAQVFINIISGFTLRAILKKLNVHEAVVFVVLMLFYSTYAITHFWPWYNHSVFFYQLAALLFIIYSLYESSKYKSIVFVLLASFLTLISFLTKQDGGGFTFLICNACLLFVSIKRLNMRYIIFYNMFFILFVAVFIFLFKPYDLFYWFNLGQYPHISRLYLTDILHDFLDKSRLMKIFLFTILLVLIHDFLKNKTLSKFLESKGEKYFILVIISFTIIFESIIIQVTSYFPHATINYFYSFGILFILNELEKRKFFNPGKIAYFFFLLLSVTVIWSNYYWFYGQKLFPSLSINKKQETAISKYNQYNSSSDSLKKTPQTRWVKTGLKSIDNIKFPKESKEGISRLIELSKRYDGDIRVLNMSQLTFMAYEMNFIPEASSSQPLWYHKGVNVFEREIDFLCRQIQENAYDIIIFQDIPKLRDYFPYEVFDCAQKEYNKEFEFPSTWTHADSKIWVFSLK